LVDPYLHFGESLRHVAVFRQLWLVPSGTTQLYTGKCSQDSLGGVVTVSPDNKVEA
jgi:hypothetical protein